MGRIADREAALLRALLADPAAPPRRETGLRAETEARVAASAAEPGGPVPEWPARWWEDRDPGDAAACRKLWCAVLHEAVKGLLQHRLRTLHDPRAAAPIPWIGTRDARHVCALAGIEHDALEAALSAAWRDPVALRAVLRRMAPKGREGGE